MLLIILGPRTRLAAALLSLNWVTQQKVILAARDEEESEWLLSKHPQAKILQACGEFPELSSTDGPVIIFCCALGLIHPVLPRPSCDVETTIFDLTIIEKILNACEKRPLHFVFVSSILALSTPRKKMYYGGWKCVAEAALEAMLTRHPKAFFSVLYPGRIIERPSLAAPASYLYTRYEQLAKLMQLIVLSYRPCRMIVGLDARLLIMIQGVKAWVMAITGLQR